MPNRVSPVSRPRSVLEAMLSAHFEACTVPPHKRGRLVKLQGCCMGSPGVSNPQGICISRLCKTVLSSCLATFAALASAPSSAALSSHVVAFGTPSPLHIRFLKSAVLSPRVEPFTARCRSIPRTWLRTVVGADCCNTAQNSEDVRTHHATDITETSAARCAHQRPQQTSRGPGGRIARRVNQALNHALKPRCWG